MSLIAELDIAVGLVGLPSNYAKDIEKQADLANGTVFNCYRSSQRPLPLALLYPEFDYFSLRCASPAGMSIRDTLFCLELCQEMQCFMSKETKRELTFGNLFREYLQGQLSPDIALTHQTRGKSIIDIQLQTKVGIRKGTVKSYSTSKEPVRGPLTDCGIARSDHCTSSLMTEHYLLVGRLAHRWTILS